MQSPLVGYNGTKSMVFFMWVVYGKRRITRLRKYSVGYYSDLFTTGQPMKFNEILDVVHLKVTVEMNQVLTKEF